MTADGRLACASSRSCYAKKLPSWDGEGVTERGVESGASVLFSRPPSRPVSPISLHRLTALHFLYF